jgi:hypothetical protein
MKFNNKNTIATVAVLSLLFGLKCTQRHELAPDNSGKQSELIEAGDQPGTHKFFNPDLVDSDGNIDVDSSGLLDKKRQTIKKSAQMLTSMFNEFKRPEFRKSDFIDFLIKQGLEPEFNFDEVEGIDNLSIIRTANTLKGIRYIHAQYTGESGEDEILQHLSFEMRPSITAFKDAKALLEESFPGLDQPLKDTAENMVVYKHEGYVVWIKELDEDDVRSDPFNPRTSEDIGSVKVAIEYDIHPHHH